MINIQKQYITIIRWKLIKASLWDRLKFKVTFGLLGRMEWLDRTEKDVITYLPVIDKRVIYSSAVDSGNSLFNSGFNGAPPRPINCRCSVVKL